MIEKDGNFKDSVIESVLEEYGKNASNLEIMEEALRRKVILLDFKEPDPENMLEIEESEKIESDANLFKNYDFGVVYSDHMSSIISQSTELYENAIKFEFRGKEASLGCTEEVFYNDNYNKLESYYDVTFLVNISSKDRLHISTIDSLHRKDNEKVFEEIFKNYEEILDKYDVENALRYAEYFSDRIPEIKEEKYSFKYKLNNIEKEFLINIYETYKYQFTLSFKFGVMCISSKCKLHMNYIKRIEEISYFIDCMLKIIERFMN